MVVENRVLPLIHNLDEFPLVDTKYKIAENQCEFDLYELHNWENKKK